PTPSWRLDGLRRPLCNGSQRQVGDRLENQSMSVAEELERLQQLRDLGTMTEEEFLQAKARLLNKPASDADIERRTGIWAMCLHLSVFTGYAAVLAGFIAPVLIWQLMKDELPGLDVHGRNVVNWIISLIIYATVSFVLCLLVIGIPMLIALGVMAVV